MAVDFNNPQQVEQARQTAIAAGYKPDEIDRFIQKKRMVLQAADSIQSGIQDPSKLGIDETGIAVSTELKKRGYKPVDTEQKKMEDAKLRAKPEIEGLVKSLDSLKERAKDVTVTDSIVNKVTGGNFGTNAATYEQSKKLMGQYLAKLVEKGRLSDADRKFYQQEIMNVGAVGRQGAIEDKLDNLKQEIIVLAGYDPKDFGQKKNEITKPQKKSSGNIIDNAVSDIKNLAQGVTQLPRIAGEIASDPIVQKGVSSGNMAGTMIGLGQNKQVQDMVKGSAQEYLSLAKDPVGHAIEHPVNTALDVMPAIGAGGKVVNGVKSTVGKVGKATKASSVLPDIGINAFASNFTIPSKLAGRIKIDDVAKTMIENGHTGDLNKLSEISQQVTGQNGIFPKLNRDALALVKDPIPFDDAISTGSKLLDDIPELSAKQVAGHKKIIRDLIKPTGEKPGQTDAFSAFDAIQELEKRGYQYKNSSTKLTPNLVNEKIGDAYIQAADELKTLIDTNQSANNIIDALKTPENIAQIEAISPKLAEQFINAKSMKDLRKIQSPYVRLKQAIDLTQEASNTPFSQMGSRVARGVGMGVGGAVGFPVGGPIGSMVGAVAGGMMEPFIAPVIERVMPSITTKASQILKR